MAGASTGRTIGVTTSGSAKQVLDNGTSIGLCGAGGVDVVPHGNQISGAAAIRTAIPIVTHGSKVGFPTGAVEHMPAIYAAYSLTVLEWVLTDTALFVLTFVICRGHVLRLRVS